ncbi:MAG: hypothetical protein Edafosvirus29_10 [Edafosvirus sp.]|uniref:Uncharacterized protein n=1 Tax=Edafosvirus sp. TaxID=2487765 RepID=A0A3G4ZV16_9VIRU|nr:MAG: hypothetical protein Edafosvirus29_10 [Edafosvirus sp.]
MKIICLYSDWRKIELDTINSSNYEKYIMIKWLIV